MNDKQKDMEINAAIIKARELLEEIPGVDSIIGAWDVYCAHMNGPTIQIGPSFDEVINNPNPQDQRIGLQILVGIYNRLAPFEDRIVSLFNILDFAKLPGLDEIVRNRLNYLNSYCSEFHTYQTTIKALGLLDGQGQKRKQKQPRPKKQSKTIKDYILLQDEEQKNELLKVLHSLLDNKLGRWAGLVVAISVKMGLLVKPTFKMLVAEFGDIGNESGFNRYFGIADKALNGEINTYTKNEISIIKDKFSCFVTQDNSAK